ncbi:hypothetical protein OHAE_3423 [Ochrobactrum soli]|uniref:Uncharacterized protein n=1 Tax=Ochrobactrum soli TaxID=2448455 RepID=A0A2P9HHA7_9HYPH|nr:hypothetical protein OHAE_3423 [[Ochrobactrum] soli]
MKIILLYFVTRITLNDSEIGGGKPASRRMGGMRSICV